MLFKNRNKLSKQNERIGKIFAKAPLTPNQWTVLSLLLVLITAYFIITESFAAATLFFAITAFLDVVDGAVARHRKSAGSRGAYIDTITDRYVEFIVLFSMLFVQMPKALVEPGAWIFLCLFGSTMTTYAKAAAKEKSLVEKELTGGILERAERLVLLFIGIVLAIFSATYLLYVLIIYAVLSNITALQRIRSALSSK